MEARCPYCGEGHSAAPAALYECPHCDRLFEDRDAASRPAPPAPPPPPAARPRCPRCEEFHRAAPAALYECPFCGTLFEDASAPGRILPPVPPRPAKPPVRRISLEVDSWFDRLVRTVSCWSFSTAFHILLLLAALTVAMGTGAPEKESPVLMIDLARKPVAEIPFEYPRDVFDNRKPVRAERVVEDPVFRRDAEDADHNETADDEPFREAKGDALAYLAETPFRVPTVNDTIGVRAAGGGAYGTRLGGRRNLVTRGGGSKATEGAVLAGLRWLARHQDPDGRWAASGFRDRCGTVLRGSCDGRGRSRNDTGVTGLAVLAFLGAGYTHLSRDVYDGLCFGDVVRNGIRWLIGRQDDDGCVGPREGAYMYSHAIAALALSEAYGLTGSGLIREDAQQSIDFLFAAQNPYAGWRYGYRCGDTDTSVTGWCVMAIKSAEISGLKISLASYDGARTWLDRVTSDEHRTGYMGKPRWRVREPDAMTAVGVMSRIFIDRDRTDAKVRGGAAHVAKDAPVWRDGRIDYYAWYYTALALFQYDGPTGPLWRSWNDRMKDVLVRHQRPVSAGCLHGSWDPVGRWCGDGGRIYATAVNTLTLEVYYRYENVFGVSRE